MYKTLIRSVTPYGLKTWNITAENVEFREKDTKCHKNTKLHVATYQNSTLQIQVIF